MNTESEYLKMLKSATFESLETPANFTYSPDESPIGLTVAPPANCDIRFRIGTFKLVLPKFSLSKEEKLLPLSWSNYKVEMNDEKADQKMLVTKPVNQGHCGSCFAVAIATTISDNFLFGKKTDYNPSLSPMYILSCLAEDTNVNNQCNGGNPSGVLDLIINKGGISTNCCQNYYKICESNQYCNGKGEEHMNRSITMEDVNTMIPKCGHCTSDIPSLYKIKNKVISFDVPSIKLHIYNYGSAVGGFLIYSNFMKDKSHGKFEKSNGIYIRSVDYAEDGNRQQSPIGGHAISIVGWGTSENVKIEIEGNEYVYPKVDYWVCRNSWSDKWGDNGYFKYAMYQEYKDLPPINKNISFETDNSHYGQMLGGILLIEPESIANSTDLNKVDCNIDYKCDKIIKQSVKKPVKHTNHSHNSFTIVLLVCLLILAIFCIYLIFKKESKHHK